MKEGEKMEYNRLIDMCMPFIQMLVDPAMDPELSLEILKRLKMEMVLDIQAVMIVGKQAVENELEEPHSDAISVYQMCRKDLPDFDEIEELWYLVQPKAIQALKDGMWALKLGGTR